MPDPAGAPARVLDLGGDDWLVREALGMTWRWYAGAALPGDAGLNNAAEAAAAAARAPAWLPATVPGSVVTDLHRAGEVPDPYVGRNSRAAEWVSSRSWVHRRTVDLPQRAPGERVVLELDGVDPGGTVLWDGEVVGEVHGLYHRTRVDVTGRLAGTGPSRHRLAVVVHPAPDSQPQVGRTDLVRVHAPRMAYGWDFCPRLVHQGVWRPVRVVVGAVQLAQVTARTEVDAAGGSGRVHVAARVETSGPVVVEAEVRAPTGEVVGTARTTATGDGDVGLTVDVPHPALWWPAGYGPQDRHELRVTARSDHGATATWARHVGFRHVSFEPNPGAPPAARPWTAVVNGRPVELLGWNWAPADVQVGAVAPDRVEHLVDLAVSSGAVVLRVWGGGLLETEELYDACDRRGLLVWQEFSQSSSGLQSAPAQDDAFVEHMRAEARAVVPPRTRHPSLLMWGGGNELEGDAGPLEESGSRVLAVLGEEVRRLDPGRHWVPTSPTGPVFHNRLDVIAERPDDLHDVHGPWEHQGLAGHPELYDAGTCLAHTEFGVEGMTSPRSLDRLVPAEHRWPPGRENPFYRHLGEWWDNAPRVQEAFGHRLTTIEQVQRASRLLQATGLAYAVEADRRRYPRCSAVVVWQLQESYPNAWCTCVVDHRGDAKPALHATRRAFAADRVTLRASTSAWAGADVTGTAWVWSRDGVPAGSTVRSRLLDADGHLLDERSAVLDEPVRHPRPALDHVVPARLLPADAVVVRELDWRRADGTVVDREAVLATTAADLGPLLDLGKAQLDVTPEEQEGGGASGRDRWRLRVSHVGGPVAVGLEVLDDRPHAAPGWAAVDGDPRPLLPGEQRVVEVRWRGDAGPEPRRVGVTAWNTAPVLVQRPVGSP